MKTRLLITALAIAMCLSVFGSASAATHVSVHYDDWDMPITGYLKNGTTYVPIRQFFNLLGGSWVTWNEAHRSATVQGNVSATFYLDSNKAQLAGTNQTITGTTYSVNGSMYVPLRALAVAMDCGISYNGQLQRVTLAADEPYQTDDGSLYWLARIIEAESGAEPYHGKLAVGNVILNRVKSRDFPNSIYGVIFDRKNGVQFTPIANGTIYNTPSAESIRAAKECLAGTNVVGNCLYFFNPSTATKADWIVQNCSFYTSIGNHDFYLAR